MKIYIFLVVFIFFGKITAQKKVSKKFETTLKNIAINTAGLDDFVLETATSNTIEILLFAENLNAQHLSVLEENKRLKIEFKIPLAPISETVFRKFITKRLQRAKAIVKIPKNASVTIFGENSNITSKSYQGNLSIYIEKGIVKLDTIQQNLGLKMYAGTVFGSFKKSNITLHSNIGILEIDGKKYVKDYRFQTNLDAKNIEINTVKANIFLTPL